MADETTRDITYGDAQSAKSVDQMGADTANIGGMNLVNYSANLIGDPSAFFSNDMKLSQNTPTMDANATGTNIDGSQAKYAVNPGELATSTSTVQNVAQAQAVKAQPAATYTAAQTAPAVQAAQMTAAQGTVNPNAIINPTTVDMQGMATGTNKDGTTNYAGQALQGFASQNISTVIDTSTMSGKLLAQTLGEGNYTDAKATVQGQMEILSKEFVDSAGNPKIPTWAAGVARSVSRIAAFKGMTGTAATAALSQAIMEATLPIAQQDAQFFQTLTVKNLDNKQQQTINTANVLSKMEMANMDARNAAAVENAKNFMQMDLTNLTNAQQAAVVNTQARVQSILEDAKAVNTQRLFSAQSTNEMDKFYASLNTNIQTFNAAQTNAISQFNAGATNTTSQFNATMENNRSQFYQTMQYNVDLANAKWRQSVETTNNSNQFQAAALDVKNMFQLSSESFNQMWDRMDSLLSYAFTDSQNDAERDLKIAYYNASLQVERDKINAQDEGFLGSIGKIAGTMAGSWAGSAAGGAALGNAGTAIAAMF